MTVQKNKYFIGSYVFAVLDDAQNQQIYFMKINGIYKQDDKLIYQDEIGVEVKEENIFPDKQSAEASLNDVRLGDEVYYLYVDPKWDEILIKKSKVTDIHPLNKIYFLKDGEVLKEVFKNEEELIRSLRSYE